MYTYQTTIRLHHTDAAGVVFFSNLFVIAHDAYESFLESHLTLNTLLSDGAYIIPIVHAEADYLLPLTLSETLRVELSLEQMGTSSFNLGYVIKNSKMETAVRLKTIHAVQLKDNGKTIPIPEPLRHVLETLH
ncbi:MAG: acyl-CoA thioesterase [Planctomycetota bacterium]|jgi:YbgC/YbaW family acyl-CoA thioester hydrolase